jgi:hypothetical protein
MTNTLNRVVNTFSDKNSPIDKSLVLAWMQDSELEVIAAVSCYISKKDITDRITPQLKFNETFSFLLHLYARSLKENNPGEWAETQYGAAREVVGLIKSLWSNNQINAEQFGNFKKWLADLFITGDSDLKECIVNAILEHLFEDSTLLAQFEDWKSDRTLAVAYNDSLLWVNKLGNKN